MAESPVCLVVAQAKSWSVYQIHGGNRRFERLQQVS
jgi:hypothetical protein